MKYQFRSDSAGDLRIARHIITNADPCDGQNNNKSGCQNKPVYLGLFTLLSLGYDLDKDRDFTDDKEPESKDDVTIGCLKLCVECADEVAMTDSSVDLILIADAKKSVAGYKEVIPRGAFSKTKIRQAEIVEFLKRNPWSGVTRVATEFRILTEVARRDLFLLRDEGTIVSKFRGTAFTFAVKETQ